MTLISYLQPSSQPLINAFIGLIGIWFFKWLFVTIKQIFSLPSGPWGLPIVGYLPFIKKDLYLELDRLADKYGPVFSVKLGQENIVVISDWPHMKEAFSHEDLLARPAAVFFPGIINIPSFVEMSGYLWRQHRRLSLHILRDVGLGKSVLETAINEEVQNFLSTLDKNGEPVDFMKALSPSISNNISSLIFGHKFDYNDPVKIQLDESIDKIGREFSFAGIFIFLPWLARILVTLGIFNMDNMKKWLLYVESYVQNEIDSHQKKSTTDRIDYIDGYLAEKERREKVEENNESEFSNDFDFAYLRRNCFAFFGAGLETLHSTLSWATLFLLKYPEWQEKLRAEIYDVIGTDRKPDYSYRNQMPNTMAFINEVHRHGSIVALNLLRRATKDVTIGTYKIPSGTTVLFNFWSVHYDPKLWTNPEKFDPTRFLTENGTKVIKPPYLVPFSGGKRICPGEGLANVEAFLYIVSILQRFKLKTDSGTELSLECSFGISRRPKHLPNVIFEKINSDNL